MGSNASEKKIIHHAVDGEPCHPESCDPTHNWFQAGIEQW